MAQVQQKREAVIQVTINDETELVLTFPRIKKTLVVNPDNFSPEIVKRCVYHGLKQKLVDAAAIARDPANGRSASDTDKYEAVKIVLDRLNGGEWNAPREGGDGGASLLVRALVRYFDGKKDRAEVETWLKGKSDVERKALRANPKIAGIIVAIQAEAADESIDSAAMLGELE